MNSRHNLPEIKLSLLPTEALEKLGAEIHNELLARDDNYKVFVESKL